MSSNVNVKSKRRKCTFTVELAKEFPYITKCYKENDTKLKCGKCYGTFSITSGRYDINRHLLSEKHKSSVAAAASSNNINNYIIRNEYGDKEKQIAIAEAVFAFHTVNHNHSFRSMDCTSKILRKLFDNKFKSARTKTEAIIKNIFAPYSIGLIQTEMEKTFFFSIYSDASNHKDIKLFPTLIRYFDWKEGIKIRMLDFLSLRGETAEMIANSIIDILKKFNLSSKLAAYCADNANTNFGGLKRKDGENVFTILNKNLSQSIVGIGCAAHIAHNAIQTAADLLPIDLETIIIKIYGYFHIYTVRVALLEEFCDEAGIEYKKIVGFCKTRWLSLMPAIERILKLYQPLKSYFLSIEKCPQVIETFFKNDSSELWLLFVHNQAALFENTIKCMEGSSKNVNEISESIDNLKYKCYERANETFLPLAVKCCLKKLVNDGSINETWFLSHVKNFYHNCFQYLEKWSCQFTNIKTFKWILLKTCPQWQELQSSYEFVSKNFPDIEINDNVLFDEVSHIKKYVTETKINYWTENNITTDMRWVEMFQHFETEHVPFKNVLKLVEYSLCLPGTNAATERVFSLVNNIWTSEKTQLSVETLKAILIVKCNFSNDCDSFYGNVIKNDEILKKINSAEKYL